MLLVKVEVIQNIHDSYLKILRSQIDKVNQIMDHFSNFASDLKQLHELQNKLVQNKDGLNKQATPRQLGKEEMKTVQLNRQNPFAMTIRQTIQ